MNSRASSLASFSRVLAAAVATSTATAALVPRSEGECQPSWSPTFGSMPGTSGRIEAMAVFDDGGGQALFVAGSFTKASGQVAFDLARLDGSSLTPIDAPVDVGSIQDLAVFDDGSGPALYVAWLLAYSGGWTSSVQRWDGTTWQDVGSVTGFVDVLAVFDGDLYLGGDFTAVDGVPVGNIAKWNGESWSAVGGGVQGARVLAMTAFDDGSGPALHVGGLFTSAGGVPATENVAKWNGLSWSTVGGGMSGCPYPPQCAVNALVVHDDGTGSALYVGGDFDHAGPVPALDVARWDGTAWSPVGSGFASIDGEVEVLASFGGKLHAGGRWLRDFPSAACIASWTGDDWTFPDAGPNQVVSELAAFDDGSGARLFAGGQFTSLGETEALALASTDGADWSPVGGPRLDDDVFCLLAVTDESGTALVAGGDFQSTPLRPATRIARFDGAAWSALGASAPNGTVRALAQYDDGSGEALYAAGDFTLFGGAAVSRVAKWDGATWSRLTSAVINGSVHALVAHDPGTGPLLYVGGTFTHIDGAQSLRIATWDGAAWTRGGFAFNNTVRSLVRFDDGTGATVYAGGAFSSVGGRQVAGIARLSGTTWLPVGPLWNLRNVEALAVHDGGDGSGPSLYACGSYSPGAGVVEHHVWRWDGAVWTTLGTGMNDSILSMLSFDDGSGPALLIGGEFTSAGGVAASHLARWTGSDWTSLPGPLNAPVLAMGSFDAAGSIGPALVVAGSFDVSPARDSYLALYQGCLDTIAPEITHPEAVFRADDLWGPEGAIVHFTVEASDDRDPSPALVVSPPSGSLFPRGTTLVTCTATDETGNVSVRQFPVTVEVRTRRR